LIFILFLYLRFDLWDQTTFECIHVLNGHKNYVYKLVVVRNKYLISISEDKTIIVWDILNNFLILTTTKTSAALSSIALFSNDSIITGDYEGSIQMWSISKFTFKVFHMAVDSRAEH
jgi:WD40 repeat protein